MQPSVIAQVLTCIYPHNATLCQCTGAQVFTSHNMHWIALPWSPRVFMVTLALLTIARYSQELDHRDQDQMTLGENRINIVCVNNKFSLKEDFVQR